MWLKKIINSFTEPARSSRRARLLDGGNQNVFPRVLLCDASGVAFSLEEVENTDLSSSAFKNFLIGFNMNEN